MKREWWIGPEEGREGVVAALAECEAIGERLGGAFIIVPVRKASDWPDGTRTYRTIGWKFVHDSYVPAIEQQVEDQMAAEEPVAPPPVAAEVE